MKVLLTKEEMIARVILQLKADGYLKKYVEYTGVIKEYGASREYLTLSEFEPKVEEDKTDE